MADGLADDGQVGEFPGGQHLHHQVAQGRTLSGAGVDGQACGVGGELVQVAVPAAAAHNVHGGVLPAGEGGELLYALGVAVGQAVVHAGGQLAQGLGHGLARFPAGVTDSLSHVLRGQEAAVAHVHLGGEGSRFPGGLLQGVEGDALPCLPADGLEHPQAHDVL